MSDFDRFSRLLQGRATMPQANITRQYQTPQGIVPPMALPRPTPPQSPILANQQLSPLMQQVLRNAQASRMTPRAGQVGLPTTATAAAGQPAAGMTFGQKLMQPRAQGMLGAAAAGFEASGYQDRPVSLGQVLGRMGTAGMKAFTAAKDKADKAAIDAAARKAAAEKAAFARRLAIAQYEQKDREIDATSSKTQRAITKEQFDMEDKLFNKYEMLSAEPREAFFGYEKVRNAAESYKAAEARGEKPSGASDIALLIGFMKTLDPGSVVRETEYATAKNAGGVSETIRNLYNNVKDGVLLTPKLREDFIKAATSQVDSYVKRQISLDKKYTRRAKDYNLNPERVITPYLPTIFSSVDDAEKANLPVGSMVIVNNRLAVIE